MSKEAKSLISGLLIKDPHQRLGGGKEDAKEIMGHEFFADLDWKALMDKKVKYTNSVSRSMTSD